METTTCLMPDAAAHDRAAATIDAAIAAGKPIYAIRKQCLEQHASEPRKTQELIEAIRSISR